MKRPLKLCPCCGKDGEAETHFYSIFGVISYNAVCRKCGIQTERYETEAKAATAWNTRPYEDELTAERDRFRERCEELEARLDLGTGNMYDVVCAENEKLLEAIARANAANMSEDECISKLLDDFQVTITITPKTLPDNEEDDCEPDGTD